MNNLLSKLFKSFYPKFRESTLDDWLVNRALYVPTEEVEKNAARCGAEAISLAKKLHLDTETATAIVEGVVVPFIKEKYRELEAHAAQELLRQLDKAAGYTPKAAKK